jgi:cobalt-zinc-cadmium efflux system outer membrane protein
MPKIRMRDASLSLAMAFACTVPVAVSAQQSISEDEAIQRALEREDISARDDADRSVSLAEIDIVGPRDNPSVEMSREAAGGESEWQIGVVQPIDLNGRRASLVGAATADAAATDADISRRRQVLIAEVRSAYVQCAGARAELDVWQNYNAELAEAERVSSARAEAGDTAVYDVRRIRVEQRAAEAQLARARGGATAQCASLAALTDLPDPQVELAAITRLTSAQVGGERPDLTAGERRLEGASLRIRAAEQSRLPQLTVGAGVLRRDDGFDTAYGPAISVGVTVPIWNRGNAAVRREEARQAALQAELSISRRRIAAEQESARVRASSAREAAVAASGAREDASRLGTIAETAYQAGEIGVLELLDAFEAARDADLSVIELALGAALAAVEYDLATGRTY